MKKWQCIFCSKCYPIQSKLETHLRQHTDERPFSCSVCGKSFRNSITLCVHRNTHKNIEKSHKCDQCPAAYSLKHHLKRHLINAHNVLNLPKEECPTCGKEFTKGCKMKDHQLRVHTKLEKQHECIICKKLFMHFKQLLGHLRVHTGEKPFPCPKCPSSFSEKNQRKVHLIRKHDVGVRLRCPVCNKSATSKSNLDIHMRVHTNERPFSCSMCAKSFSATSSLNSHMRVHNSEMPFRCNICGKNFASMRSYKAHIQRHSGGLLRYPCSECPQSFHEKGKLGSHVRYVHRQVRPFSCNICGQAFQSQSCRDKHITSHLNETPYKCEICGKRLRYLSGLKGHIKSVHAKSKNEHFSCSSSRCPLIFKTKLQLSRHYLRDHVGSKDEFLSCFFCNFRAGDWTKLELHYVMHTGERPYFCSECPLTFTSSCSLCKHCRSFHSEDQKVVREGDGFPCSKCPFILKSTLELYRHYLLDHVGSNGEVLKCLFCSYRSKKLRDLEYHYTNHTRERPYFCKQCPLTYRREHGLAGHCKTAHNV